MNWSIYMNLKKFLAPKQVTATNLTQHLATQLVEIASLEVEAVLQRFTSSREGILDREADERLTIYGHNVIAREAKPSVLGQLLRRFLNPLNIMLMALASISFFMDDLKAATVISLMVLLSVLLSFLQEYRSTNAAEKLRALVHTTATVLRKDKRKGIPPEHLAAFMIRLVPRGPEKKEIPIHCLVPGDLILLSAGDMVPADVRLLSAKDLFINQSSLTGEALPVEKFDTLQTAAIIKNPLDLPNICFMGTNVISGTATAVVVSTSTQTYLGALADTLVGERVLTNFDKGINQFAWLMLRFMLVMVPLVFLINGFSKGDWIEAFMFAMAVAVGLTPEMLPMIVTINLSKGAIAMSRKKVIVKQLNSIQNFGAMDVLCTDKTGTLTQDKIILERHVDIAGQDGDEVLEYAYLNSFYQSGLKNLLDVAILKHIEVHEELRVESTYHKVDEIPFDFARRRMSVVIAKSDDTHQLICKGAVEEIFSVCTQGEVNGHTFPLDNSHRETSRILTNDLNDDGFRVIAVAYKALSPPHQLTYSVKDENDLILVGYIAFLDPPKDSAAAAIAALNKHGVQVKVLTGDNDAVTRKICTEVGLPVSPLVLGSEIDRLSEDELREVAETASVFAKLSPAQKARVISALRRQGHVVGFLGDGINDGPALKLADVGISVDTAVDIAKESAGIILLEKNLLVLEQGVIEGRKVFGNITKYIKMGASSNFGNMFSVLGASMFLPFLPMQPIQVLTNNLLYDFSQVAIATDHVDDDYLAKPRQWDMTNLAKFMLFIGPISSIFDYVTYFTMLYIFDAWQNAALFQTGWFVESLLSQTLIVHIIRTGKIPFLQSQASLPLLFTGLVICSLGIWLPFSPFAQALGFTALPTSYWLILGMMLAAYLTLTHFVKSWFIKRFGLN